jgi:hypothetical protein
MNKLFIIMTLMLIVSSCGFINGSNSDSDSSKKKKKNKLSQFTDMFGVSGAGVNVSGVGVD